MPKKKKLEEVVEVEVPAEIPMEVPTGMLLTIVEPKKIVGKLDLDFGREDLNKLRDKVNELVDFVS